MHINPRWLLLLLLLSTCLLVTDGKRGGGSRGGSRGSGSRGSSTRRRPTYRPASRPSPRPPAYKPSPLPAPKPTVRATARPQPPSPRPPAPAATPKPSAPQEPVVVKQPGTNPNFKETNQVQGSANSQPAHNPNYKPESGAPGGAPPPYSPAGHPAPSAPVGPPPPYSPNAPGGQRLPQPGVQPPPYPGLPGRPPAYPGQSAPYPQQPGYPGSYPRQPGYPQQPGYPGGYPQQPGYPGSYPRQPGHPGSYPQQPGYPGSYPRQPGLPGGHPYPQQPGGNVWRPQSGMPSPAYMNYGGIPTGTNMYSKPHKQKGFLGSLMGMGSHNTHKKSKYGGAGVAGVAGLAGLGAAGYGARKMGGGFLGKYGRTAAMYTIMPYVAYKATSMLFRPRFMFMPFFMPTPYFHHYHYSHHGHGMYPGYAHYYDVYSDDYVGKCQRPIKKENTDIRCKTTYDDIKCDAKCKDGFEFPENITLISNRCWHVAGVWRPNKNFPECTPICNEDCMNGGECIRPDVCKCPAEFRGSRCQFRKLNFLDCDIRKLTKEERNLGWVCQHFKNETECTIRCKEPAEFESPAAEVYKCAPTGEWTPNSIPRCIEKEKKDNSTAA